MKTKLVYVDVTEQDIQIGVRRNLTLCPIAQALRRITTAVPHVGVSVIDFDLTLATGKTTTVACATPSARMQRFIEAFDGTRPVKPTRFRIPIPVDVLR